MAKKLSSVQQAEIAYRQEFGTEIPDEWAVAFDAYRRLEAAGWKYSRRYGWHKPSARSKCPRQE